MSHLKILLAEDDRNLGMILKAYLDANGHTATLCTNGDEAWKALGLSHFDFCIFDISMPLMDGFAVMDEINKIGPADASLSKKCDLYRRVIDIKSREYDNLIDIKDAIEKDVAAMKLTKETVMFDFNPMSGF